MSKIKRRILNLNRFPRKSGSRRNYLRLDKNEGLVKWQRPALKWIFDSIASDEISMYPQAEALYRKLAKYLGISEENILLTNGSDGGIKSAFEAFISPGDKVLILDPTYAMYDVYIGMFGAKKVGIEFNNDFTVDSEKMLKLLSRGIKLVAIANPNSPTGTVFSSDFLLKLIKRAGRLGAVVLIDEAYYHFYPQTLVRYVRKFRNLIVLRTFSKAWGAASLRLGYAIACKEIIDALSKVRPMYEAHMFAIKTAQYLLDHPRRLNEYLRFEKEGKKYLLEGLRGLGFASRTGYANFVLVKAQGKRRQIYGYLKSRGILVYLPSPDSFLADYFRITTGPRPLMEKILKELKRYKDSKCRG